MFLILCSLLFPPAFPRLAHSLTSPNGQIGCLIQAVDGPAAGCALTHNSDRRNNFSYWIHTQPIWLQNYDRWLVTKCEVNSQDCYKIKALDSSDHDGEHTRCKPSIESSRIEASFSPS